ncbi:MAG: HAD-IA family hydrolase [Actinomycetota bacterium]|nr:HAD-IA family hydrolase [Actinomycetota bacterium]
MHTAAGGWFRAAVFDLDGLLVDSEPLWHQAEIEIFGRYGVRLTVELCRTTKGRFVGEVAQHWFDHFGWVGPSPADVAKEIVDRMAALLRAQVVLKPGAIEALDACARRGLRVALASSSSRRLIEAALGRHGLTGRFEAICSAEDVGAGKPDPAVFLVAALALEVPAERCVVLEDSGAGVEAARAAGMACVLVPEERVEPAGTSGPADRADVVLGSLVELDGALSRAEEAFLRRRRAAPSVSGLGDHRG